MHTSMPIPTHKHGIIPCLQSKPLNNLNTLGIKCTLHLAKVAKSKRVFSILSHCQKSTFPPRRHDPKETSTEF